MTCMRVVRCRCAVYVQRVVRASVVAGLMGVAGCASLRGVDVGVRGAAADFNAVPLLPGSAMLIDGSFRMHIEVRERANAAAAVTEQQDLLLVLRSDAQGFRFEAMNELGLPLLTWPATDRGAEAAAGMRGGMDAGLVARFIQLALAEPAAWGAALSGTRLQLVTGPDGSRTLLIGQQPRIHVSAAGASPRGASGHHQRRMLVCMQSSIVFDRCRAGRELQIDVEALPESVHK